MYFYATPPPPPNSLYQGETKGRKQVDVVIIAIYGPMIYTALYVMVLIRASPLRG
jgi:hypothetical protein